MLSKCRKNPGGAPAGGCCHEQERQEMKTAASRDGLQGEKLQGENSRRGEDSKRIEGKRHRPSHNAERTSEWRD